MTLDQGLLFEQPIAPTVAPLVEVSYGTDETLQDRFDAFHRANPEVFVNLRLIALDMRRRGIQRWAIAAIFERLRWLYKFQTAGDDYKLNNSWRAFYARMLMDQCPELAEPPMFELRVQKSLN